MKHLLTFALGCLAGAIAFANYQAHQDEQEMDRLTEVDWSDDLAATWDGEDPLPGSLFIPTPTFGAALQNTLQRAEFRRAAKARAQAAKQIPFGPKRY